MFPSDFNETTIVWAILFVGIMLLCIALWKKINALYFVSSGAFAICGLYIIVLPDPTMVTNVVGMLMVFMAIISVFMPIMTKDKEKITEEKSYNQRYIDKYKETKEARNQFRSKRRNSVW